MKIRVRVTMDLVGCERVIEDEVDDGLSDEEINEIVRDIALEHIEWSWESVRD